MADEARSAREACNSWCGIHKQILRYKSPGVTLVALVTLGVRAPRDSGAVKAARLVKRLMLRCYKSRCAYLENTWWQEK